MKIVKPSFRIEWGIKDTTKKIERAARNCYKSEDRIGEGSDIKLIKSLIDRNHKAMLEFSDICVSLVTDRGIANELVRHRLASYAQECVTGDTVIHKKSKYTIKYLYERQNNTSCYDKTHNKTLWLNSVDDENNIISNKAVEIFYKGIQPVYKVKTLLGYEIKTTLSHKFLSINNEYKKLEDLKVKDIVYVNGRPCLLKIDDTILKKLYVEEKLNPGEIADMYNVPYRSVLDRLKKSDIFVCKMNDKNKEKYNKNHTFSSYEKMRNTIKEQYEKGRKVWNYGIKGENSHMYGSTMSDINKKKLSDSKKGAKNHMWRGGVHGYEEARLIKEDIKVCELCDSDAGLSLLEVHHKDKNPENNIYDNLIKVCVECHNLLHHGWTVGKKIIKDIIESIEYVGEEEVYDIEMRSPYHNYIANGFVTHNSTRYCNYNKDKFDNQLTFILPMRYYDCVEVFDDDSYNLLNETAAFSNWLNNCENCEKSYLKSIRLGEKPEEARDNLPLSLKTEIFMKCNITEWRHVFTERAINNKAHPHMRQLMIPVLYKLSKLSPVLFSDLLEKRDGILTISTMKWAEDRSLYNDKNEIIEIGD